MKGRWAGSGTYGRETEDVEKPILGCAKLLLGNAARRWAPRLGRVGPWATDVAVDSAKGAADALADPKTWKDPSPQGVGKQVVKGAGKGFGSGVAGKVVPKSDTLVGKGTEKAATKVGGKLGSAAAGALYDRATKKKPKGGQ